MCVGSGGPQSLQEVGGGGLSKPGSLELPKLGKKLAAPLAWLLLPVTDLWLFCFCFLQKSRDEITA